MQPNLYRIALIGPESTGKTTLCIQLSEYFKTIWVPEFAREYFPTLKHPYSKKDVLFCAEMQIEKEDALAAQANKLLFADTELINIKIWLLDKYGECPSWIEEKIMERKYNLYLLTAPDIAFENDPLRENPERREYFFNVYKAELESRNFPFAIISGTEKIRFEMSRGAVRFRS